MIAGLYPLCDVDALGRVGLAPLSFVNAVLAASPRPALLQLRAKSWSRERIAELLSALVPSAQAAGVPLVVNDHFELALHAGAPFVHVGQSDPFDANAALGLRWGRSTHSLPQLRAAVAARPDYVAYGPVFDTASKTTPEPTVGLEGLRAAHAIAREAGIPLCAIGGIDSESLEAVGRHCELVAVIGAVVDADPAVVTERVSALGAALARAQRGQGR